MRYFIRLVKSSVYLGTALVSFLFLELGLSGEKTPPLDWPVAGLWYIFLIDG